MVINHKFANLPPRCRARPRRWQPVRLGKHLIRLIEQLYKNAIARLHFSHRLPDQRNGQIFSRYKLLRRERTAHKLHLFTQNLAAWLGNGGLNKEPLWGIDLYRFVCIRLAVNL